LLGDVPRLLGLPVLPPEQLVEETSVGVVTPLALMAVLGVMTSRTLWVAVGTPVTRRPPHRSVREELPHTAPASGQTHLHTLVRKRMAVLGGREPTLEKRCHFLRTPRSETTADEPRFVGTAK